MRPTEFEELVYTVGDGVATLRLNRPEARNAFSSRLYAELKWGVRAANLDPDVDVIVVTGTGTAFATGGDLKETLHRLQDDGVFSMYAFTDNLPWWDMRDCTKVTIAAINGYCYAGGLITALWCDLTVAVESATFALTEAKVGIADAMAPSVAFGRIPTPKLKYMLFTGRPITAAEAERYGIIGEVVGDGRLEERVAELIGEVRGTSPVARAMFKRYINELIPRPMNHGGDGAFTDPAVVEGLSAFSEKRSADYR